MKTSVVEKKVRNRAKWIEERKKERATEAETETDRDTQR